MAYPVREAQGVATTEPVVRDFLLFAGESEHPTNRAPVHADKVIPIFTFLAWNASKNALIPWEPEAVTGVAASGYLVVNAQPTPGDYITVDDNSWFFVANGDTVGPNEIEIGDFEAVTADNISYAFQTNGVLVTGATEYYASVPGTQITARATGTSGNSIRLSSHCAGITVSGPTLTGGVDAVVATSQPFALLAVESPVGTQSLPYYEAGYFNELAINWPVTLSAATLLDRQYALRNAERFTLGSLP